MLLNNATNNNIISAPVALNSKVMADIAAGTQLTLTGQLAGATALNINPDSGNTGTLIISANNAGSLTAAITLNAGLVNFGAGSLGSGPITFAGTSTLQYASNNTQDISSQLQAIPSGVTATIDTGGNNVGFGTGLSGGGGLTKAGSGILTLVGTNTYQGATLISGGGLAVNGSLAAASTVTVNANTTLGGSGTVNGPGDCSVRRPCGALHRAILCRGRHVEFRQRPDAQLRLGARFQSQQCGRRPRLGPANRVLIPATITSSSPAPCR